MEGQATAQWGPQSNRQQRGREKIEMLCPAGKALTMEASDLSLDPQHWLKSPVWGWTRTCHLNSEVQGWLANSSQFLDPFWVTMAREHRFRSPQITCSNMETVSQDFYTFIQQIKSWIRASLKDIGGYMGEVAVTWLGKLFYSSKMLPVDILHSWMGGS